MVKKLTMLLVICVTATLLTACGGSDEYGTADDVKDAFADGDIEAIYDMMVPEAQAEAEVNRDDEVRSMAALSAEARTGRLKNMNESMWWMGDKWEEIKEAKDMESLDPSFFRGELVALLEVSMRAKEEEFSDQVDDLRVCGYSRRFSGSNPEWGSAEITYRNRWGDKLTVGLVQRAGSWFVAGVDLQWAKSDKRLRKKPAATPAAAQ